MHLIVPFAYLQDNDFIQVLRSKQFNAWASWLSGCAPPTISVRCQYNLPEELIIAEYSGVMVQDGLISYAEQQARQRQLYRPNSYWAQISLCCWQVTTQTVTLQAPELLRITAAENQQLLDELRQFFAPDAIELYPTAENGIWLAQSPLFNNLASASLAKLQLRQPASDLLASTSSSANKTLMRLQQETQMLLYNHPLNQQRSAQNLPNINGFIVYHTGSLAAEPKLLNYQLQRIEDFSQPIDAKAQLVVLDFLTAAVLQHNWQQWQHSWAQLTLQYLPVLKRLASRADEFKISFCAEDKYLTYTIAKKKWFKQLTDKFKFSALNLAEIFAILDK